MNDEPLTGEGAFRIASFGLIEIHGTPALLCGVEPTHPDESLGIDWTPWIDDRLSSYGPLAGQSVGTIQKPICHARVPKSGEGRGITREDVERFVCEDDARRSDRATRAKQAAAGCTS